MDEVIATIQAERGFVMLVEESGTLDFRAARGFDHHDIQSPEFEISRGTVQWVAREGQPILTSDAQTDDLLQRTPERRRISSCGLSCASP